LQQTRWGKKPKEVEKPPRGFSNVYLRTLGTRFFNPWKRGWALGGALGNPLKRQQNGPQKPEPKFKREGRNLPAPVGVKITKAEVMRLGGRRVFRKTKKRETELNQKTSPPLPKKLTQNRGLGGWTGVLLGAKTIEKRQVSGGRGKESLSVGRGGGPGGKELSDKPGEGQKKYRDFPRKDRTDQKYVHSGGGEGALVKKIGG